MRQLYSSVWHPSMGIQQTVLGSGGTAEAPQLCPWVSLLPFPLRFSISKQDSCVFGRYDANIIQQGGKHCILALAGQSLPLHSDRWKHAIRNMEMWDSSLLVGETVKILASLLITGHIFGLKNTRLRVITNYRKTNLSFQAAKCSGRADFHGAQQSRVGPTKMFV